MVINMVVIGLLIYLIKIYKLFLCVIFNLVIVLINISVMGSSMVNNVVFNDGSVFLLWILRFVNFVGIGLKGSCWFRNLRKSGLLISDVISLISKL